MVYRSCLILLVSATFCVAEDAPPASVQVLPASIELRHHRHFQSLLVAGTTADGWSLDLRSDARVVSADPKIATIDERGLVRPVANGETKVSVTVAGKTIDIPVKVQLPAVEGPMSFRHEVMPVLTRGGCNAGGCHGYSLGKNGFKLSLRGQDPEADYFSIAREFTSRRISPATPEASLVVGKATGEITHEGGVRFARGSLSHDIFVKWVRQGVPSDLADTARVVAVKLQPDKLVLRPNQKHRLQLIAEYADGTRRDVTRLGVFHAGNTLYADVDDEGLVVAGLAGETAVVGRFERIFSASNITVLNDGGKFTPTPVPQGNLIDRHVVEKLNRLRITPSAASSDEEFLRRVHLDTIGVQPKPEEVREFLASKDANKREKAIDALFERSEFVDHWSLKWGDLLQNSRTSVSSASVYQFREFIRGSVASNMPMDRFAKRILTARGGIVDDPAAVWFAIGKDANENVERATQVFCGVRMLCARCHDHPMENWRQSEYYGLASFFNQVGIRADGRYPSQPNTKMVQLNLDAGMTVNPRSGQAQPAKFLGGETPTLATGKDRRQAYADWLTSPKNPFFARAMVNRVWSWYFHRGIIDPVDDIRSTNPPINPELLDALTKDFIDNKYDVRRLMRLIVTSATYQRSSIPNDTNRHDEQNFSRAVPRRIPAEALLDTLVQATAVPENFGGVPGGFRAAQLPDGNVDSPFLKMFGKPQRMEACECERDNGSNMLQALQFINGKSILSRVQNPNGRPALIQRTKMTDEQMTTELYLWTLARLPNAKEMKVGVDFLNVPADKKGEALQDFMWALLNSKDFLLVH